MTLDDADPRVARAVGAFNEADLDGMLAAFADDGIFVDPLVPEGVAGGALREYCADVFAAFPDVRFEVDRVLTNDDGGTALVGTYEATHEGPLEGIPPTGNAVSVPVVAVVTVGDDGITHWRDYWDGEVFAEQLGLTFPAILPKLPGIVAGQIRERL